MTLSTGHISVAAPRRSLKDLLHFLDSVFQVAATVPTTPERSFLDSFATPLELSELPDDTKPTGILLDLVNLREGIATGDLRVEWKRDDGKYQLVDETLATAYIDEFTSALALREEGDRVVVEHPSPVLDGSVRLVRNKSSYSLTSPLVRRVRVLPAGGDPIGLRSWLREAEALRIAFSRPQYAYLLNQLFEDSELLSQLPTIRQLLQAEAALDSVTCEKHPGKSLPAKAKAFDPDSMFHFIEQKESSADFLVCDDLGNEWADYVSLAAADTSITFWHAKFDGKSSDLSASHLHEVVSQALKNVGYLRATREVLANTKKNKWWDERYASSKLLRRRKCVYGNWDELLTGYCEIVSHLQYAPRIALIVNCIARPALYAQLDLIEDGKAEDCRFQVFHMIWLLSIFASTCSGQGIEPIVLCRP